MAQQFDVRMDDPDWLRTDSQQVYCRLRKEVPVHWMESLGAWLLTKHADVSEVSKDSTRFRSGDGFQITDVRAARTGQQRGLPGLPDSLLAMDPPRHTQHRRPGSSFFTPATISRLETRIRDLARKSVQAIAPGETHDFVEAICVHLPVMVIAEILGVPSADHARFRKWSDDLVALAEGDSAAQTGFIELFTYMMEHARERRTSPRDDLLSSVAAATPEGRLLTEAEMAMFGLVVLAGGNETTRNLVSGGLYSLMNEPTQLAQLAASPSMIPGAVEEMLRRVSPIRAFVRSAIHDTEIRGQRITAGDFLVLSYSAANRDEEIFGTDSECFNIARSRAADHIAFGLGPHFCLGAHLARLEARILFEELLARFPRLELAGEVQRLRSSLINGIERMPVRFLN